MIEWPEWWNWELVLSAHVLERMADRQFTEIDLRSMMQGCSRILEDDQPGRFVVECRHGRRKWKVIVEPDRDSRELIVITAFVPDNP